MRLKGLHMLRYYLQLQGGNARLLFNLFCSLCVPTSVPL